MLNSELWDTTGQTRRLVQCPACGKSLTDSRRSLRFHLLDPEVGPEHFDLTRDAGEVRFKPTAKVHPAREPELG
jgi:hypothetical protein